MNLARTDSDLRSFINARVALPPLPVVICSLLYPRAFSTAIHGTYEETVISASKGWVALSQLYIVGARNYRAE